MLVLVLVYAGWMRVGVSVTVTLRNRGHWRWLQVGGMSQARYFRKQSSKVYNAVLAQSPDLSPSC
jgi:hypothetical protein